MTKSFVDSDEVFRHTACMANSALRRCYLRLFTRLFTLCLVILPLAAQTPAFEVASIKPSKVNGTSGAVCRNIKVGTETVEADISFNLMVIDAYEAEAERFDLPEDWGRNTFEVRVKMPPTTNVAVCRLMLRNLLAERFHLMVEVKSGDVPT